jgi:formiminotetrahydrofolate cyclodeaminase
VTGTAGKEMVMFKDMKIEEFLETLASSAPTPGGGTAAALAGAAASALLGMFSNLTVGKKKFEEVDGLFRETAKKAETQGVRFRELMDTDARAFDKVMKAYALPKETDDDKKVRSAAIQEALKKAASVPLETASLALEVLEAARDVAPKGNPNAITDIATAGLLAEAAIRGALLNVYINLGSIKDEEVVEDMKAIAAEILSRAQGITGTLFEAAKKGGF